MSKTTGFLLKFPNLGTIPMWPSKVVLGTSPQAASSAGASPSLAETADHSLPLDWAGFGQSLVGLQSQSLEVMLNGDLMGCKWGFFAIMLPPMARISTKQHWTQFILGTTAVPKLSLAIVTSEIHHSFIFFCGGSSVFNQMCLVSALTYH